MQTEYEVNSLHRPTMPAIAGQFRGARGTSPSLRATRFVVFILFTTTVRGAQKTPIRGEEAEEAEAYCLTLAHLL